MGDGRPEVTLPLRRSLRYWNILHRNYNIVTLYTRTTLDSLVVKLFGDVQRRWLETTFPFTHPSLEAEILFKGAWLEVYSIAQCESATT